jgi:hypothetical protein
VPDVCTCGARLLPDSRFCHKCGKPQRDEPVIAEEEVAVETPVEAAPPPLPEPPPISFHNGLAVRVALIAGAVAFFCSLITGQISNTQPLAMVWMAGGGFLAVYLYKKRSGQKLSVVNGARLGWICGIFGFVVVIIALTGTALMLSDPAMVTAMREQLHSRGVPDAAADQMMNIFHTPSGLTTALLVSFVLFTILPAFGGALGAKLLDRD